MNEKTINTLKDILSYIIIIIIVVLIRVFIFDPVRVDGPSMDETLSDGQILILDKLTYKKNDIKRYDIVVIKRYNGDKIIKRVIGLPNEYIEIKDNKVYADGKLLDSSYVKKELNISEDYKLEDSGLEKIPGDSYFVLGDNRRDSLDSRYSEVGTIRKSQILGKAKLRIWPLNKIGKVK